MKKDFTVNIPDEIWIDRWEQNKTLALAYDGPSLIYAVVSNDSAVSYWSEEEITRPENYFEKVVAVDADAQPEIAYYMMTRNMDYEYIYADEINPDGSIWTHFTNPRIQDYFDIRYDPAEQAVKLFPIYKRKETVSELKAIRRRDYVRKYADIYSFDTEMQEIVDKFLADTDAYLKKMENVYPWKYIEIDESDLPKVPYKIQQMIDSFPGLK